MSIRVGANVLAKIKRKGFPPTIVSGFIARFTGDGKAFLAVDGLANPQPATSAEREMLIANHATFRNGKRICHAEGDRGNVTVEVDLVDLDHIKAMSKGEQAMTQEVKKLLDSGDLDALVVADALMSRGLLHPVSGGWTMGDSYAICYCLSRMCNEAWTLEDCFEDLCDPDW